MRINDYEFLMDDRSESDTAPQLTVDPANFSFPLLHLPTLWATRNALLDESHRELVFVFKQDGTSFLDDELTEDEMLAACTLFNSDLTHNWSVLLTESSQEVISRTNQDIAQAQKRKDSAEAMLKLITE